MKKTIWLCLIILGGIIFLSLPTLSQAECCLDKMDFEKMVLDYAPLILQAEDIPAEPQSLLYRATTSDDCKTLYLAYHIVWPFEQDPRPGFWPALTRLTYTGGLKFQQVIYGPGDVEVLFFTVDLDSMKIRELYYETADYDKKGNVIHVDVNLDESEIPHYSPLAFQAISWNHMFDLLEGPPDGTVAEFKLTPEPFTDELWAYYRITKKRQTPLSKDRAHLEWETGRLCP